VQPKPAFQSMKSRQFSKSSMRLILLSLILAFFAVHAEGYCSVPPKGAVTFCDINYLTYHINKEELDSYWTVLDSAAEKLSRAHESMKCLLPNCKKYECGLFFLKCNDELDAPLRTCR
jgi:hypothetical protein